MATLDEVAEWVEGVYLLEPTDPVLGGSVDDPPAMGGMSNRQALALACRTLYLKTAITALAESVDESVSGLQSGKQSKSDRLTALSGATASVIAKLLELGGTAVVLAELNRLSGVSGNVQSQLDGKQPAHAKLDALANLGFTANRGLVINGAGALALGKVVQFMPKATIRALTGDIGPIIVEELAGEAWKWTTFGAYYTGYASPYCGGPIYGVDAAPRAHEIDAIGGIFNKADHPELWGWAQWRGLVKSQAEFDSGLGSYWFVADPGGDATKFRAPNLLGPNSWGMFLRMAAGGVDADTANAVPLGARKLDTVKAHSHIMYGTGCANGAGSRGMSAATDIFNTASAPTGTAETAPRHVAFYPRIHV